MRLLIACVLMAVPTLAATAEPDSDRLRKLVKSENYSVTWGEARSFDATAVLEIGHGNGHGGTLGWVRFRPDRDGVECLAIQFDIGFHPYKSKWPPERESVTVRHARMKSNDYAQLLTDLATVDAARLKAIEGRPGGSFNDFWVFARLSTEKETLIEQNWVGYEGHGDEIKYAKPRASVALGRDVMEKLAFKKHELIESERAWASEKFARDWKMFKKLEFGWWVRERYIETIGFVGDKAALPTLRDILMTEPPKDRAAGPSPDRCTYHAINSVTRLTKTDVRDKPVEEMDLDKTRQKVLEMIRDKK